MTLFDEVLVRLGWRAPVTPRLMERDVIAKARAVADEHGWTWIEPAQADFEPDYRTGSGIWKVVSNAHAVGMNVRVYIDDATGAVLEKGFLPR